jgi:hypothetical protein
MIEADELKLPGIAHGFFTRAAGIRQGCSPRSIAGWGRVMILNSWQ